MRFISLFIFLIVNMASFARAESLISVVEQNSCSTQSHCHNEVDLQTHHYSPSVHDQDIADFANHDSEESHEHTHRHSPNEPAHSHPHQHSSFSHAHSSQFLGGHSYDLKIGLIKTETFPLLEDSAFQGPFLDSLFRPPIV